jgi:trigger factor
LNSTVEPLEGNLVKLTVTIPATDVDKAIAEAYAELAKKIRVPGFRKGHAPRPVVDTYAGRQQVLAQALEAAIDRAYSESVDTHELRPIEQPDVGELAGLVEGEDYTFVAEVPVRPELKLTGDYEHMRVTVEPKEASEREVDEQIEALRERFASLEPVEDRGVEQGDFTLISFVGLVDGEPYEGNTADKFLYELGRGQMPAEFDDALIGAKAGDEVRASLTIPDTSSNPEFVGKTATFDITVHEVKSKLLPELDDEFAGNAGGFDTVGELRADFKQRLDLQRGLAYAQATEREVRRALAEHLEGEVPQSMVESRRDNMLRDFYGNLKERGISLPDYMAATGVTGDQIQKDVEEEAAARVAQELALEALFRAKGMEVTDADIDTELEGVAGGSGKSAAELRTEWETAGVLAVLRETVMQRKAVEWLIDNVEIVEEEPAAEEDAADVPAKPKRARKGSKKED